MSDGCCDAVNCVSGRISSVLDDVYSGWRMTGEGWQMKDEG